MEVLKYILAYVIFLALLYVLGLLLGGLLPENKRNRTGTIVQVVLIIGLALLEVFSLYYKKLPLIQNYYLTINGLIIMFGVGIKGKQKTNK